MIRALASVQSGEVCVLALTAPVGVSLAGYRLDVDLRIGAASGLLIPVTPIVRALTNIDGKQGWLVTLTAAQSQAAWAAASIGQPLQRGLVCIDARVSSGEDVTISDPQTIVLLPAITVRPPPNSTLTSDPIHAGTTPILAQPIFLTWIGPGPNPVSNQAAIIVSQVINNGNGGGAGVNFIQSTPSPTWTIAHNLGFKPAVSVSGQSGQDIEVEVQHLSDFTLQIRFVTPTAGSARLT